MSKDEILAKVGVKSENQPFCLVTLCVALILEDTISLLAYYAGSTFSITCEPFVKSLTVMGITSSGL